MPSTLPTSSHPSEGKSCKLLQEQSAHMFRDAGSQVIQSLTQLNCLQTAAIMLHAHPGLPLPHPVPSPSTCVSHSITMFQLGKVE